MHISDNEKPARRAALHSLLDKMGGLTGKKLAGIKKPASHAIEPQGEAGHPEPDGEEMGEGGFCPHCGNPK